MLIESDALTSSAIYGSVYGLVVITVERYVKIVHPVAHRNHYRRWMTRVGVATPWLIGLLTSSVPSLTSTKFVDGTCTTQVRCTMFLFRSVLVTALCSLFSTLQHDYPCSVIAYVFLTFYTLQKAIKLREEG